MLWSKMGLFHGARDWGRGLLLYRPYLLMIA